MSKHDKQHADAKLRDALRDATGRRDRGQLTDRQMVDRMSKAHDEHLATYKDIYRKGGAL